MRFDAIGDVLTWIGTGFEGLVDDCRRVGESFAEAPTRSARRVRVAKVPSIRLLLGSFWWDDKSHT